MYTVELTARTAIAGNFRKATTPRAAAKVRVCAIDRDRARVRRARGTRRLTNATACVTQANVNVVTEAKVKVAINGFGRIGACGERKTRAWTIDRVR